MGITVGEHRRQVRLGSEAVYRVCELDGALVELEVVQAPGLRPGRRFRFRREAVEAMSVVNTPPTDATDRTPDG
jgi:hypothetical protein